MLSGWYTKVAHWITDSLTQRLNCWRSWILHLVKRIRRTDSAFRQLIQFTSLCRPTWFCLVQFEILNWFENCYYAHQLHQQAFKLNDFISTSLGLFLLVETSLKAVSGPQMNLWTPEFFSQLCLSLTTFCTAHSPYLFCWKKQFKLTRTNIYGSWITVLLMCHMTINSCEVKCDSPQHERVLSHTSMVLLYID